MQTVLPEIQYGSHHVLRSAATVGFKFSTNQLSILLDMRVKIVYETKDKAVDEECRAAQLIILPVSLPAEEKRWAEKMFGSRRLLYSGSAEAVIEMLKKRLVVNVN